MKARDSRGLYITLIVLAVSGAWFSIRSSRAWLASGFMDPVGHLGSQDEAVYCRVVLEMITHGNWLVPTFLGRFAYFKPPLLYWLSAASIECFGASTYTLRLPSLLAAMGTCGIAWVWLRRERGVFPALVTLILIATDHYWVMMSSVNMTDAPLVLFSVAALWAASRDLRFQNNRTLWLVATLLAAAALTKSAAAIVPAVTVAVCARSSRVWRPLALAAVLASPWFVYTLLTHGQWFWDEHVLTELLGNSVGVTPMATQDSNLTFYASRFFLGDPLVAWLGVVALGITVWKRNANKSVIIWLFCNCAALLLFRYHAAPYLLPVVTALALTVGFALPSNYPRWRAYATCAICATLLAALLFLYEDQAIQWNGTNVTSARALESYCELGRNQSLFILQPNDEYYSALLPIPRVLYGVINHDIPPPRLPIDWRALGVVVTQQQFDDQTNWWPLYRTRLARMGLDIDHIGWHDPRGTAVLMRDESSAASFIRAHAELDFFVPKAFALGAAEHDVALVIGERAFLFSKIPAERATKAPLWSCRVGTGV